MNIIKYTHIALTGSECLIEPMFKPSMDTLCGYASICGLKLHINSSKRNSTIVKGAIVTPAQMSNHLVGHAIDCNIEDGKVFWSSKMLEGTLTGNVKKFIDMVSNDGSLRWGGNFHTRDVVHFDDMLNIKSPLIWHELHDSEIKTMC